MATTRRRFTAQFKAKVAMEALRGDRTIQAIAAKHEVHPNQVSGWKRQAQAGLQELFAGASNRRQKDHEKRQATGMGCEGILATLRHRSASVQFVTSLHRSDCFRLERQLPGGFRTRWDSAPFHAARQ